MKVGDIFVSSQGTNLRLTITGVDLKKKTISFSAERRTVDRKTGEVIVEERERTVDQKGWKYVEAGYVRAR